ncbi:hypothetical protein EG329_000202 [Mollisiaceae sp. DMI_Dod_QoI]|nr:hypothetical protein EG329_000202 [Helotiales sp. DMI_Dod_QoI]
MSSYTVRLLHWLYAFISTTTVVRIWDARTSLFAGLKAVAFFTLLTLAGLVYIFLSAITNFIVASLNCPLGLVGIQIPYSDDWLVIFESVDHWSFGLFLVLVAIISIIAAVFIAIFYFGKTRRTPRETFASGRKLIRRKRSLSIIRDIALSHFNDPEPVPVPTPVPTPARSPDHSPAKGPSPGPIPTPNLNRTQSRAKGPNPRPLLMPLSTSAASESDDSTTAIESDPDRPMVASDESSSSSQAPSKEENNHPDGPLGPVLPLKFSSYRNHIIFLVILALVVFFLPSVSKKQTNVSLPTATPSASLISMKSTGFASKSRKATNSLEVIIESTKPSSKESSSTAPKKPTQLSSAQKKVVESSTDVTKSTKSNSKKTSSVDQKKSSKATIDASGSPSSSSQSTSSEASSASKEEPSSKRSVPSNETPSTTQSSSLKKKVASKEAASPKLHSSNEELGPSKQPSTAKSSTEFDKTTSDPWKSMQSFLKKVLPSKSTSDSAVSGEESSETKSIENTVSSVPSSSKQSKTSQNTISTLIKTIVEIETPKKGSKIESVEKSSSSQLSSSSKSVSKEHSIPEEKSSMQSAQPYISKSQEVSSSSTISSPARSSTKESLRPTYKVPSLPSLKLPQWISTSSKALSSILSLIWSIPSSLFNLSSACASDIRYAIAGESSCIGSAVLHTIYVLGLFALAILSHYSIQFVKGIAPGPFGLISTILMYQPVFWGIVFSLGHFIPFPFGYFISQIQYHWQYNRYFVFFFILASFKTFKGFVHIISFYFYTRPAQPPVRPTVIPEDVTVIVPSIGNFGEDFQKTIKSILVNTPKELIIATVNPGRVQLVTSIIESLPRELRKKTRITVDMTLIGNKRSQFLSAVSQAETSIICYADDHVMWPSTFLQSALAPFEDAHVGMVGTVKAVERVRNKGFVVNLLNYIGCIYLERHNFECTATYNIDGGVFVISGRTGLIRREILASLDFRTGFLNEMFSFGLLKSTEALKPDDDNYMTRYCVKNGWKTVFHNDPKACIGTSIGVDSDNSGSYIGKMQGQLLRWARTTWRSNLVSLFIDRVCWRAYPWTTYAMFISSFVNLAIIYDLLMLGLLWLSGPQSSHFCGAVLLLFLSKCVKPFQFFLKEPEDLWLLPFGILFGYFHSVVRLYALWTVTDVSWGGRNLAAAP